jgi:mycothiol synthase
MIRCRPDADVLSDFSRAVAAADAPWGALSEHKQRGLDGSVPADVAAWCQDGGVVAVAVAADHVRADGTRHVAVEAALLPELRSASGEGTLVDAVRSWLGDLGHTFWAWRPGQIEALQARGYRELRAVVRMERTLPVPRDDVPSGFVLDRFRRGEDEGALVALNNAAFAGHPENDNFTLDELDSRMALAWFDDLGIVTARRDDELVGFCWTKIHSGGDERGDGQGAVGEIYIVAVGPAAQGRGIGKAMVLEGLRDLHERKGADLGMLWVEAANTQARALYRGLGFRDVLINRELESG